MSTQKGFYCLSCLFFTLNLLMVFSIVPVAAQQGGEIEPTGGRKRVSP
jgi:hypothetical protein